MNGDILRVSPRLQQNLGVKELREVSNLEVSASSLLSSVVLGGTHEPLGTMQTPGRPYA